MTAHFVVTQDPGDKRFYLSLHLPRRVIQIGNGYRLRADCNSAMAAIVATSVTTPVMELRDEE